MKKAPSESERFSCFTLIPQGSFAENLAFLLDSLKSGEYIY